MKQITVEKLVQWFDDAEDATHDARTESERCRDYYDGNQWTTDELAKLKDRNQPPIVFNMIQPKVDFLLGYEKQTRTDPKAYPRTPEHDEAADAATDGIRYVLDNNEFDCIASDQFEHMAVEGTGGASVEVDPKTFDIVIRKLAWNRFFIDPHSMNRDGSDARYMGYVSWKDAEEVYERWPDAKDKIEHGMQLVQNTADTKDDKPTRWYSGHRRRVMCVDMCFIWNGVWHNAIFVKGAWLEDPAPSTYVDEDGVPQNKFIIASAKVDRDGQRYSPIKHDLDKQDEVNKRRSKSLHLLNTKQTFSKHGQLPDINAFKKQVNKPDGHVEFPASGEFGKDFGILPTGDLVGPQFEMYMEAKQSLDMAGANQALQGTTQQSLSGKAIRSLQQGGLLELAPLFDTHSHWKKRIYRAVWDRIKQFWREEKWIRVTDNEENLRWVGLNVPITLGEQMVMEETGMKINDVRQVYGEELQVLYQQAPQFAEPAVQNDVAEIDVDIIIEEVPDVINLQSEQFELLVQMYQANPWSEENPDGIKWEHVIQMSTLRNKDQILGKELTPEEQAAREQAMQAAQEAQQLQKAAAVADLEHKQVSTQKMLVDTQAQAIENAIVQDEHPHVQIDKAIETRKKAAETQKTEQEALQKEVETALLLTNPAPDKVAII